MRRETRPTKHASGRASRELVIYSQHRIGLVIERGGRCDAFDQNGVYLGEFRKFKAALSAVNLSVPLRSCVADASARMDGSE